MLATFGRVLARTTGLNATTKPLPVYKTVISLNQFLPTTTRALATATAPKKAGTTTTKKTTTTTTNRAKTPTKKTTTTTSTTKKAPAKTAATKKVSATVTSRKPVEAPKREKKKVLSDDEKLRAQVKALLAKALNPPNNIHAITSTWVEFLKMKFAAAKGNGMPGNKLLSSNGSQWVSEYKALSPAQVEALRAKAEAIKESKEAELVKWVRSHTPAEIHEANLARIQIRRLQNNHDPAPFGLRGTFPTIPDDRYPRGPRTANIFYVLDKLAGVPVEKRMAVVPEAMKNFATLPASEQNKYKELAAKDLIRYHTELRTVGIQPSSA